MTAWWADAVFYQIYPRSFVDSNGDGVGDLRGIESRLDYLVGLGVDALWLSPFFPSPMRDFGYDVADYRDVDAVYGGRADFSSLMSEAKRRGLRVVLDLVANHSSDEHPWFREARLSRSSPKHDWYLWVEDRGRVPNNWKALFELGSAWHRNAATGEFYLGTFTRHQPEFDWRNEELRKEFYDIMRFWYELGVDGFRLDVATAYLKDAELRSNPWSLNAVPDFFQRHLYDRNRPEVHEVFREMRRVADGAGERVLIGEPYGQDHDLASSCYGRAGDELHLTFNFDFLRQKWAARNFRDSAQRWYAALPEGAWPTFTLGNHDQPRQAWRYRGRTPQETDARLRVAAAMLLTLRGTPILYYGDEIGMGCVRIPRAALRDPLGIKTWPLSRIGRDSERTPMQWDSSSGAGFSSGVPWLPLNPDWQTRNVALQEADSNSLLSWYRGLLSLRSNSVVLKRGGIRFLDSDPDLLLYERFAAGIEAGGRGSIRVCLNFGSRPKSLMNDRGGQVLCGSRRGRDEAIPAGTYMLEAYEILIYSVS